MCSAASCRPPWASTTTRESGKSSYFRCPLAVGSSHGSNSSLILALERPLLPRHAAGRLGDPPVLSTYRPESLNGAVPPATGGSSRGGASGGRRALASLTGWMTAPIGWPGDQAMNGLTRGFEVNFGSGRPASCLRAEKIAEISHQ